MKLTAIDHIVLTVRDLQKTIDFYTRILGCEHIIFGENRHAIQVGSQKINLHQQGAEHCPHAKHPTPGSVDLCMLMDMSMDLFLSEMKRFKVPIEKGPVERTGALGPILSAYIRDPDGNLIEIAVKEV